MSEKKSVEVQIRGIDRLLVARTWWNRGVVALPLHYGHKRPAIRWKAWQEQRPDWADIFEAFDTRFYRNIGLLTGSVSGNLVVLDFDKPAAYIKWRRETGIKTYTVITGRGFHVYVRLDEPPAGTLIMQGGEVKASGYVVAAPSLHSSGVLYRELWPDVSILRAKNLSALGVTPILPETFSLGPSISSPEIPESIHQQKSKLCNQIKSELRIDSLLSQYTVLTPSGSAGWFVCRCPFHDDHRPSMWVNTNLGICKCYKPTCRAHGDKPMDVINLYSLITGLQNGSAIFDLAQRMGILNS